MNPTQLTSTLEILNRCSDLNCQEKDHGNHFWNWKISVTHLLSGLIERFLNLYHGIQNRMLTMLLSTPEGRKVAIQTTKEIVTAILDDSKKLSERSTAVDIEQE
ncbi:C (U1) putative protein [Boteke virus]|uniref:Uncharacterized protein n=1 Tax=Boteke virus TaxID=864698 RepID=A0AAE8XBJ6_9RHAB|nr:C (U1) putative protein [Boteke virus]UAU42841.1 C (U1) putative protein [Boteke virus]